MSDQTDKLAHCAILLEEYVCVLRGEKEDLTGRGLWNIIRSKLEAAMSVKIISKETWENIQKKYE